MTTGRLRIAVLCPHFAPDTAPTGDVITAIVSELASLGHRIDVVTALPWYRAHAIEPGWTGRLVRRELTAWGTVTRVHPFPGKDKRNLWRRAGGFIGFSALAGGASLLGGRVDAVLAMSPPFTMGVTGWGTHLVRRGPLIFNIQDVFPDAAIATGAISGKRLIAFARWFERTSYQRADVVTVLSDDMRDNVTAKFRSRHSPRVEVIANFVDTEVIHPLDRMTALRAELGIGIETVVMYAGNVGYSQSLEMVVDAARTMPEIRFVINGDGVARAALQARAAGVDNVHFGAYQPKERLAEVLATGDVHLVPLRAGLGSVSVPSKTYSILAAGRPVLAAIDAGTEVPRVLRASGAGVAVAPDDPLAFADGLRRLVDDPAGRAAMGVAGRAWVEANASPAAAARAYETLIRRLAGHDRQGRPGDAAAIR